MHLDLFRSYFWRLGSFRHRFGASLQHQWWDRGARRHYFTTGCSWVVCIGLVVALGCLGCSAQGVHPCVELSHLHFHAKFRLGNKSFISSRRYPVASTFADCTVCCWPVALRLFFYRALQVFKLRGHHYAVHCTQHEYPLNVPMFAVP